MDFCAWSRKIVPKHGLTRRREEGAPTAATWEKLLNRKGGKGGKVSIPLSVLPGLPVCDGYHFFYDALERPGGAHETHQRHETNTGGDRQG